jgi:hypothetical protein
VDNVRFVCLAKHLESATEVALSTVTETLAVMQYFDIAHVREQGVDLIIVFVDQRVGRVTDGERAEVSARLTLCSRSAGLAGFVVLVWPGGFYGDRRFHPFFESAPYEVLAASINRKLTCENL